jgi:hypothetical protein
MFLYIKTQVAKLFSISKNYFQLSTILKMPVSRKHRSMKKSSKRSKNARTSKKTRKHMRKMRGGAALELGVNQAVDFIIYSGNQVLVSKNTNVITNIGKDFALIGTFAASGSDETNKKNVKAGIAKYNENLKINSATDGDLHKLEKDIALALLKKDLAKNMTVTPEIEEIIKNIEPVDDKFYMVNDDKRLSEPPCKPNICMMKTQLFKVEVPKDKKYLFEHNKKITNKNTTKIIHMAWKPWDNSMIFPGHKAILLEVKDIFNESPAFTQ